MTAQGIQSDEDNLSDESHLVFVDANFYYQRTEHSRIIGNLADLGVSAQLIDFIFQDKVDDAADRPLVQAVASAGNVYLGMAFESINGANVEPKYSLNGPSARKMGKGRNLYAMAKDGREFPVEVGLGYSRGQEGILFSAVIVDISRQLEVEREREGLIAELKEALSTVKNLSGLLPICSGCKKIRDDTGYWNRIEAYIRDHSEADFSYGICPDCAKKLYPDLDIYGDPK